MTSQICFLCAQAALAVLPSSHSHSPGPFRLPSVPRAYQQAITQSALTYQIELGGTLDEFNTASYPNTRLGYTRLESKFQPNKYLVIENTGMDNVVNPRIVINGRRDWHSAESILGSVIKPDMTDAEKAMAIYYHTADVGVQSHDNNSRVGPEFPEIYDNPSVGTFQELADPVKATNSYYTSGCSPVAANYVVLARQAGFDARVVWLSPEDRYRTHSVAEVFYEGEWHVFDPDSRAYYLDTDNKTVASYESIHNDPTLFDRTHLGGFGSIGIDKDFGAEYAKYSPGRIMPVEADWISTMDMTLRPGEKFVYRWDHDGKFRWGDNPRNRGFQPPQLANGKIIFEPYLDDTIRGRDSIDDHNIRSVFDAATGTNNVQPEIAGSSASLIYQVSSPYPIVGGMVGGVFSKSTDNDIVNLLVSKDGADWTRIWSADGPGNFEDYVSIDKALNAGPSAPIYDYFVKVQLLANRRSSDAQLRRLQIETDVQMAESALPALSVGTNRISYRDESGAERSVRISHGWQESSATIPPDPPDNTRLAGGLDSLKLRWDEATDPDGGTVADYHVQVSLRPDMLFPLAPNFDRILFSDTTQWDIPDGWLEPDSEYFWRVRAKDQWGAWSRWSETASFSTRIHGPNLISVPEPSTCLLLLTGVSLLGRPLRRFSRSSALYVAYDGSGFQSPCFGGVQSRGAWLHLAVRARSDTRPVRDVLSLLPAASL